MKCDYKTSIVHCKTSSLLEYFAKHFPGLGNTEVVYDKTNTTCTMEVWWKR